MYVVFVHPPVGKGHIDGTRFDGPSTTTLFPPGLLYVAAACEGAGHKTEIIDFLKNNWKMADFKKWLLTHKPDVIGFSTCVSAILHVKHLMMVIMIGHHIILL